MNREFKPSSIKCYGRDATLRTSPEESAVA